MKSNEFSTKSNKDEKVFFKKRIYKIESKNNENDHGQGEVPPRKIRLVFRPIPQSQEGRGKS